MLKSKLRFGYLIFFVVFLVACSSCGGTRKQADVPTDDTLGIDLVDPYTLQLENENARLDSIKKANDQITAQALAAKDAEISRLRHQKHQQELDYLAKSYEAKILTLNETILELENRQKIATESGAFNKSLYANQKEQIGILKSQLTAMEHVKLNQQLKADMSAMQARINALEEKNNILVSQKPSAAEEAVYKEFVNASYINYWMEGEPIVHYLWLTDAQASKLFEKSYLPYYNSLRAQGNKIKTALEIVLNMQKQAPLKSTLDSSK